MEVATLDEPGMPWEAGFPAPVHPLGPTHRKYGYAPRLAPWLRERLPGFDAVIINGLWQYHGLAAAHAARCAGKPYFVFPHGMLDPWFRRRYPLKHLKKWLYWPWAEYRVLRDAHAVLFTCDEERLLARESFSLYRAREVTIGYGIEAPAGDPVAEVATFRGAFPALAGKRLLLFLSRLHEKKGCDILLDAFAKVAGVDPDLVLMMAGPDQTGLKRVLEQRAKGLDIAQRVIWPGMLQGELKWGALRCADAFALISHQENFGIAVVEALACGTPVIISNQVNIWREIHDEGAGLICEDSAASAEQALHQWALMTPEARAALARRALTCFQKRFCIDQAGRRLADLVLAACSENPRSPRAYAPPPATPGS